MSGIKVEESSGRLPMAWGLGAVLALLLAMSVSGCNTMEGAGEDISAAGGAMSDTAEDVEDDMD
jgi:predicted small secreted protein